jgi:hypothetical protein
MALSLSLYRRSPLPTFRACNRRFEATRDHPPLRLYQQWPFRHTCAAYSLTRGLPGGAEKLLSTNIITLNATTTISGAHRRIGVSRFSRDPSLIIDVFVPRLTCAAMLDGSRVRRGDYPTPIKSQSPLSPRSSYSNTPPHQLCARLPLARGGPVQSKPTSSPYEMGEAHQLLKGTAFFPPG